VDQKVTLVIDGIELVNAQVPTLHLYNKTKPNWLTAFAHESYYCRKQPVTQTSVDADVGR
jgi:hypothetical protein